MLSCEKREVPLNTKSRKIKYVFFNGKLIFLKYKYKSYYKNYNPIQNKQLLSHNSYVIDFVLYKFMFFKYTSTARMKNKNNRRAALLYHAKPKPGKIEVNPTTKYSSQRDLALAYSPGVAYPCLEIEEDPNKVYKYTSKGNLVAVITNGTAVLGLGDIGPEASKPVMEGKALLI